MTVQVRETSDEHDEQEGRRELDDEQDSADARDADVPQADELDDEPAESRPTPAWVRTLVFSAAALTLLLVGATVFVTFDPTPFGGDGYSAMPVQIFNYALRPQEEFQALAAAGIIVMLIVLFLTTYIPSFALMLVPGK